MKKCLFELGLLALYNSDVDFTLDCRMVTSVAFVPFEDLEETLLVLNDRMISRNVDLLLDWFQDSYIGRVALEEEIYYFQRK